MHRLDGWIANFRSPAEKYFAARVLDALIYRSNRQTVALMKQLFQRVIPDAARVQGLDSSLRSAYWTLRNGTVDPRVRIVPVIPAGEAPTKSGGIVARMLRRHLRFSERWIVHPEYVSSNSGKVYAVVFVDDFLGTGTQFSDFVSGSGLEPLFSTRCCIYAPLAAHTVGVDRLQSTYGQLCVAAVELLEDNHAFFHEESGSFPDDVNSTEAARDFYYDLMEKRGIDIFGPNRRGFGHFELTYVFEHAIPDNSLPILWWRHSEEWRPLFDR